LEWSIFGYSVKYVCMHACLFKFCFLHSFACSYVRRKKGIIKPLCVNQLASFAFSLLDNQEDASQ